jgi:hypothetical protein
MRGCYGDNGLGPGLVHLRELVEEHKRELVVLVGNLDHIAVNGVEGGRDINRYFLGSHGDPLVVVVENCSCLKKLQKIFP